MGWKVRGGSRILKNKLESAHMLRSLFFLGGFFRRGGDGEEKGRSTKTPYTCSFYGSYQSLCNYISLWTPRLHQINQ